MTQTWNLTMHTARPSHRQCIPMIFLAFDAIDAPRMDENAFRVRLENPLIGNDYGCKCDAFDGYVCKMMSLMQPLVVVSIG